MAGQKDGIGCRDTALATGFLLGFGIVMFATGLTMIHQDPCAGLCETVGLTLLYAGGPISALFGIPTDQVIAAWPLDVTLWVVLGFGVARYADRRGRQPWGPVLAILALFITLGLVLSQLVELTV